MDKNDLLKIIAQKGYDIGFGAKKHFATYDLVEKVPNYIGLIVLFVGILQLGFPEFTSSKLLAVALILVSIIALFINLYASGKDKYEEAGIKLTKLFNKLKKLYYTVKNNQDNTLQKYIDELNDIESEFYSVSITKQIFLSDWFAHFKFFNELQIDWIDEQLSFKFFKDKFPKSLMCFFIVVILFLIITFVYITTLSHNGSKLCICTIL